jgi:septal ring factor EnvC (AmiA/AmiB activator)
LALPCLLALPGLALADAANDRQQVESRLQEVTRQIGEIKSQLEASRADHRAEQQRLQQVDLAIQQASLAFRELEQQRLQHAAQLDTFQGERDDYLSRHAKRMEILAKQLGVAYRAGRQSRMKLLLNQDDPARLGRMLAYYDYLNEAQVSKIFGLRQAMAELERMQQPINRELLRIQQVQSEQREVLDQLGAQRLKREQLLVQLTGQISSEEAQLKELERNRKDLESLIERLSDALADIPADLGNRTGVASRKGRLPMPLKGPVKHAFGQTRAGSMRWQGWLIGAAPGTEATAVAYGRVAFADWLRGYGLLLIIDHGQGYLSLYAHNESLLQEAGAWVEAGERISVVGDNPGNEQGLYFELRRNGKAVDPAAWLSR